ncbi:MAG TPA: hypothetical protein DCY20_04620 [Firmicutes bacterium]|nr:hypothetical protein [Bacillota bacterium]
MERRMDKILVINASPKGRASGTLKVTNAFLAGFKLINENVKIEYSHLSELNISHCEACQTCFHTTPGVCHIVDDMTSLLRKYSKADYIILSFPLHNYGVGSYLEKFLERLEPLLRFTTHSETEDTITLDRNYTRTASNNFIMISTSGSTNITSSYKSVVERFNISFDGQATTLFFPNTKYHYANDQTSGVEFLKVIEWAGQDFAKVGYISSEINKLLNQFRSCTSEKLIVSKEVASQYFWLDAKQHPIKLVGLGKLNQSLKYYNSDLLAHINKILQLQFTDINEMYQLTFEKETFTIVPKGKESADCLIETTYETWNELLTGKVDLLTTILSDNLKFTGDQNILHALDNGLLFTPSKKRKDMSLYLSNGRNKYWIENRLNAGYIPAIPWYICWLLCLYSPLFGVLAGFLVSLILLIWKQAIDVTFPDKVNVLIFLTLLLTTNFLHHTYGIHNELLYISMLIIMALFFGISLFTSVPLSAYIGYAHYFESVSNINMFHYKHRIITFGYATFFMLIPLIGIFARLINFKYTNPYIILLGILFFLTANWISKNYETKVHLFSKIDSSKTKLASKR